MEFKDLDAIYQSYMRIYEDVEGSEINEAPYEITGPHTYSHGDANPKSDVKIKNTPTVVGSYSSDTKATRTRAKTKAEKLNQDYGANVYRVRRVDTPRKKGTLANEVYEQDHYDIVLEYLLDEGLCESVENAEIMMAHMSEAWIEDILDEALVDNGHSDVEKEKMRRERGNGNTTQHLMKRGLKKKPGAKKPESSRFLKPKPKTADY